MGKKIWRELLITTWSHIRPDHRATNMIRQVKRNLFYFYGVHCVSSCPQANVNDDNWPFILLTSKRVSLYRVFSLTWPASMQIYWNKRKRLHNKGVQLPQDSFRTPTWPPFHCFGTPIWPPWRHVKTLYTFTNLITKAGNVTQSWLANEENIVFLNFCNRYDQTTWLFLPALDWLSRLFTSQDGWQKVLEF